MVNPPTLFRSLLSLSLAGLALQTRGEALFSDNFETDSSANWTTLVGYYSDETNPNDYSVQWAFDYSTQVYRLFPDGVTAEEHFVPPAPGSNGTTKGVKIFVNHDDIGSRFSVNLYPKGKTFSGNFVLSFDMWMNYNGPAEGGTGSTEHGIFGINHSGTNVNWTSFGTNFTDPAVPNALPPGIGASASDGRWFAITGEGGAGIDLRAVEGTGAGAPKNLAIFPDRDGDAIADNGDSDPWLRTVFPQPKFETFGAPGKRWVHVEIRQFNNVITWTIDNQQLLTYTNTAGTYTSGDVMIGYMDIFNSRPEPAEDNWIIYDNVRVDTIRTVVVDTADNASPAGDGKTSLKEALAGLQDQDLITFNIPGAGPHLIKTPVGGYPLIEKNGVVIDGSTQPGSVVNSNGILGGNNAQFQIVLDSTSTESVGTGGLPLVTSTRLPYPGYGDSENAVLGILAADNVTIKGLSFIGRQTPGSDEDPSIYSIALIQGALNCKVQGNSFGLAPDGSVKGNAAAVAAFRYRVNVDGENVDTYSDGLVVGTDSDGVNDLSEFNLLNGNHLALALELPYLKVQGNYFNVRPDGNTFLNVNDINQQQVDAGGDGGVENIENGRKTDDSVIGTNGDGVNDANERNIFNTVVYDHLIEFYSAAPRLKVSGNYFGVGVNGTSTPVPPIDKNPDLIEVSDNTAEVQIGSNFDQISDNLEGNLVVGITGDDFFVGGKTVPITARANTLKGNKFIGFPFADGSAGRIYEEYYAGIVADPTKAVPVVTSFTGNILKGTLGLPTEEYPYVDVDIYLADPLAPENPDVPGTKLVIPGTYLGTYSDGVPEEDANLTPGEFEFNLTALNVPGGANLCVVASYQKDEGSSNPGRAVSSPVSNAVSTGGSAPIGALTVTLEGANLRLTWTGGTPPFQVQNRPSLTAGTWVNQGGTTTERSALVPITGVSPSFFQVQGQ